MARQVQLKAGESRGGLDGQGGARSEERRGGTRDAADQGRENQVAKERSPDLESGGVQGEIGGGSGVLVTVQNPDYMAHVTGSNRDLGSSGRETTGNICSGGANTSKCGGNKRSNAEVSNSSKRIRSEVWLLEGRSDAIGDGKQGTHVELESAEVFENMSSDKKRGDHGRGAASETPRSTTTGVASSVARRRLNVSTPGSNQQRSQTFHQAPSSQEGVTMQVEMMTEKGTENITYRVKLTTPMQKVMDKVAVGMINNFCMEMQDFKNHPGSNEAW